MTTPKISAADWCFFQNSINPADYYRQLRQLGVSAVEMVAPERRQAARDAGLEILNHPGPGMQKGLNRLENHAELLAQIRQAIADAKADGIPHVIVFSGNGEELSVAEGIANCITGLQAVVPYAEQAGIKLVLELLNSHDHTDYHADHGCYAFDVVRGVGSPSVGVLYDVYHMLRMGDDVYSDIERNIDVITHFHLADSPRRSVLATEGGVDYARIMRVAHQAGYTGYWGLEFVPTGDPFAEIAAAVELLNAAV